MAKELKPRRDRHGFIKEEKGYFDIHDAYFRNSLSTDNRFNMRKEILKSGEVITVISPLFPLDFILELGIKFNRPTSAKVIHMEEGRKALAPERKARKAAAS